ncbi:MAG: hypothetical protein WDO24_30305 [Pseudomonadota bacterium]
MPYQLNRFLIASPAQYEKVGRNWQAFRQQPSGTGPWKLKSAMPRERAELVRNARLLEPGARAQERDHDPLSGPRRVGAYRGAAHRARRLGPSCRRPTRSHA